MGTEQAVTATLRAVTISREYGSGGGEIAARLARRLGWRLVDHEVVVRVASALGVTEAEAESYDEHAEGLGDRILRAFRSTALVAQVTIGEVPSDAEDDAQRYQAALHLVVEGAALEGNVVIVGRGAQVLLAARRDVLHARIVAPLERRVAYVVAREGLDAAPARARIDLKDRDRARYLQTHYRRQPADPQLYDLVVNTGVLGIDDAVELLALAVERKANRLHVPVEGAGPEAGLSRYPGAPGDLRPPASDAATTR